MKKTLILLTLIVAMFTLSNVHVSAVPVQVPLAVDYVDPEDDQDEPNRTPVVIPVVEIEGNTLTFVTLCDGLVLRLVNEENEVEYITIISGSTLVLPSYLSGDYELQIISGNYIFYGDISL